MNNGKAKREALLIDLPRVLDERGNLSFVEELGQVPFKIKRAYWIYDVPGGENREGHAYRENEELIIALSGALDVAVKSDSTGPEITYTLNRSYYGLYIPAGTWRELRNFSTNSVALILASRSYEDADYIYDNENGI